MRSTSFPGTLTKLPRWSGLRLLISRRTGWGTLTAAREVMLSCTEVVPFCAW